MMKTIHLPPVCTTIASHRAFFRRPRKKQFAGKRGEGVVKRWTIPALLGALLATASPVASRAPAAEPGYAEANGVVFNFTARGRDYKAEPMNCEYKNVLRTWEDGIPEQPATRYLYLDAENLEETNLNHRDCEKTYSNLTNLDQQSVRHSIARILTEMNCEPGAEVNINFSTRRNSQVSSRRFQFVSE